jgi:hypothetical protein
MTEHPDVVRPVAGSGWLRPNAVLLVGMVLVVTGVLAVVLGSGMAPVAIGSFAYAPLAQTILIESPPLWQEPSFLGLVTTVLGLLIIAAALGYRAGRKRGRT